MKPCATDNLTDKSKKCNNNLQQYLSSLKVKTVLDSLIGF